MNNNNDIKQLSVQNLLADSAQYLIPMYQRNYAWGEAEITQLIQDIIDYAHSDNQYYIGTLIVYARSQTDQHRVIYETIDGQQRFTTLSLLVCYLKNERSELDLNWYQSGNLAFENRENSSKTFASLFKGNYINQRLGHLKDEEINIALLNGYQLIRKTLPQKIKEHKSITLEKFTNYLLNKVQIIRVQVPHDTNLNHYFEIMNNRGEQLEKNEVLKAKLLEILNKIPDQADRCNSQQCLHLVWEACANMEKYVQYGFTLEQRNALFGSNDWSQLKVNRFEDLYQVLKNPYPETSLSLDEIIQGASAQSHLKADNSAPERFHSVINFSNFLLHVLRVQLAQDIPLDDKSLLKTFQEHLLNQADAINHVKQFTFNLLKCKYLFDHYIIKREFTKGADHWSLKQLKWAAGNSANYTNSFEEAENRRILMLLAAFHVSNPTLVYKHWLNAALYYLFNCQDLCASAYLGYLEGLAKSFVFDRFLASDATDYFTIIYTQQGKTQRVPEQFSEEHLSERLAFGHIENNLIFNYLDYLLWCKWGADDTDIKDYEFTFRSSVEHYYPQHPLAGQELMEASALNSFGNLCLISHEKNSRLSNFMPTAKKEYYHNTSFDSIKQYLMMKADIWDKDSIEQHYREMKACLLASLVS